MSHSRVPLSAAVVICFYLVMIRPRGLFILVVERKNLIFDFLTR